MSHLDHPPLSRRALNRMAQQCILGPEFVKEVTRLTRQGVAFDLHYDSDNPPLSAVFMCLLGYWGESAGGYQALGVVSRRQQALESARHDPSFLLVRLDDFALRRLEREGDSTLYVSDWHRPLLCAIEDRSPGLSGIRWPSPDAQGRYDGLGDNWGVVPDGYAERLAAERVSWLDLLRHPDPVTRQAAAAYLADPADPEAVVIELLRHRLTAIEKELGPLLEHEQEQAQLKAQTQSAQAHDQAVADAWQDFLAPASTQPGKPDTLDPLEEPAPRRPRGVAEMLGDRRLDH